MFVVTPQRAQKRSLTINDEGDEGTKEVECRSRRRWCARSGEAERRCQREDGGDVGAVGDETGREVEGGSKRSTRRRGEGDCAVVGECLPPLSFSLADHL